MVNIYIHARNITSTEEGFAWCGPRSNIHYVVLVTGTSLPRRAVLHGLSSEKQATFDGSSAEPLPSRGKRQERT